MNKKYISIDISKTIDEYTLSRLYTLKQLKELCLELNNKLNINKEFKKLTGAIATDFILKNWNFNIACLWTRTELSRKDDDGKYIYKKYQSMVDASDLYINDIENWHKEFDGDPDWLISQGKFDSYLQKINRDTSKSYKEKNDFVSKAAISLRLLTSMNTSRNDLIEYMILNKYKNIMPTIKHIAGIDYFIDGIAYDQKVSRSLGNSYIKKYGDDSLNYAIKNPNTLSKSLFENQDLGRFNAKYVNRLFIVFTKSVTETTLIDIKSAILRSDLDNPYNIKANYNINGISKNIKFNSFVIFV